MSLRNQYMMVPPGTDIPSVVNAIVEIPKGRRSKFEIDKNTGLIRLDRFLYSSSHYPGDYGFIPQTLAEDDDPLDVLVYSTESIPPLTICDARAVGLMSMIDQGDPDHKIIAVLKQDPIYNEFEKASNFPRHIFKMLKRFFEDYKILEGKEVAVDEVMPAEAAHAIIEDSLTRYYNARRTGSMKGWSR